MRELGLAPGDVRLELERGIRPVIADAVLLQRAVVKLLANALGPITILEGASKQKERGTTPSESAPHNETYASNSSSTASQKTSSKGARSLSPRARQENAIKALLRRARRNGHAGTVSATDYEMEAVRALLLPAAISHARSNAKKLPQYAVLCG